MTAGCISQTTARTEYKFTKKSPYHSQRKKSELSKDPIPFTPSSSFVWLWKRPLNPALQRWEPMVKTPAESFYVDYMWDRIISNGPFLTPSICQNYSSAGFNSFLALRNIGNSNTNVIKAAPERTTGKSQPRRSVTGETALNCGLVDCGPTLA